MKWSDRVECLKKLIKEKIMVLDGGMGTEIQALGLRSEDYYGEEFESLRNKAQQAQKELKGNHDVLSLTRPEIIFEIHSRFLKAGADIVETNTFSSTGIVQAEYGLEKVVDRLNAESARIARRACDAYTASDP